MSKVLKLFLIAFVFVALTLGYISYTFLNNSPQNNSEEVIFKINPGDSLGLISQRLEDKNLVSKALYFKLMTQLKSQAQYLKVGEYALDRSMKPTEVLKVIVLGKSIQYKFTVPEGTNMYEIADIVEAEGFATKEEFLKLCRDQSLIRELLGQAYFSLEGYLYPETYSFEKETSAKMIIKTMVENFKRVFPSTAQKESSKYKHVLKLSPREQVILASMIEKETGAPEERPMISSVFHNRLKKKMKLQSDPTIIYGMAVATGVMTKNIRKRHILAPTPYNTYTVKALPIGPITNPGADALKAAANPVRSNNLYFVSRNDGTHVFTTNYKDHLKGVRDYQLNKKARTGKSWRDRLKKKVNN